MSADGTSVEAAERTGERMPRPVRAVLAVTGALVLGSAAYLWAVRGPALLLDLAHMGAKFLCL